MHCLHTYTHTHLDLSLFLLCASLSSPYLPTLSFPPLLSPRPHTPLLRFSQSRKTTTPISPYHHPTKAPYPVPYSQLVTNKVPLTVPVSLAASHLTTSSSSNRSEMVPYYALPCRLHATLYISARKLAGQYCTSTHHNFAPPNQTKTRGSPICWLASRIPIGPAFIHPASPVSWGVLLSLLNRHLASSLLVRHQDQASCRN